MSTIQLDPQNARVHDQRNRNAIKKSLQELGVGRSVVIDAENIVVAGNGVFEQAQELGLPVRIIESDGKELIAIKRIDLQPADKKRKALAIADNKTTDLSFFDDGKLAELISSLEETVNSTGFSDDELSKILAEANREEITDQCHSLPEINKKPPADTMCVIGPYRFIIERSAYDAWIESIRQDIGFDNDSIINEIKSRLEI